MAGILAVVEQRDGQIRKAGQETAAFAAQLAQQRGEDATAVVVGSGLQGKTEQLGAFGIQKVLLVDGEAFASYSAEAYGQAIMAAVAQVSPAVVVMASTAMGKDLAPYLSAKMDAPALNEITELLSAKPLKIARPLYAGKVISSISVPEDCTVIIGLRPNVFQTSPAEGSADATVEALACEPQNVRSRVREVESSASGKVVLTEAEIIVSGGRGMKEPENFKLVEDLASALGAAVGASRAVVDAGWRPHSEQVGQTGKVVTPNLYIACGISGAVQHLAGMSSSKVIVAINKDREAPIFKIASYGIVGDAMEVLPALTAAVQSHKSES